jgi:hypothetical protein
VHSALQRATRTTDLQVYCHQESQCGSGAWAVRSP